MDFFSFLAGNLQFRHDFFYSSISNESMNEWSNECGKTKTKIYKKNRNKNLIINWTENFIEFFRFGEKKMIFANPDFVVRFLFPLIMVKGCVFRGDKTKQNKNRNSHLKKNFLAKEKNYWRRKKEKKSPIAQQQQKSIDRFHYPSRLNQPKNEITKEFDFQPDKQKIKSSNFGYHPCVIKMIEKKKKKMARTPKYEKYLVTSMTNQKKNENSLFKARKIEMSFSHQTQMINFEWKKINFIFWSNAFEIVFIPLERREKIWSQTTTTRKF